jgi:hypothetical protein
LELKEKYEPLASTFDFHLAYFDPFNFKPSNAFMNFVDISSDARDLASKHAHQFLILESVPTDPILDYRLNFYHRT